MRNRESRLCLSGLTSLDWDTLKEGFPKLLIEYQHIEVNNPDVNQTASCHDERKKRRTCTGYG
ncbi:hypothetical protein GCM10007968_01390 [Sporolactobacillus putidus]|uniref:Uncharacterized protein n=1 Tax=Sporolactobacillus putidus TaxID=492735 RepID=A0A917RXP7_9BACL|nr:hypothetical protein GCM10007968_01390 [Sporolactobacillus putidus]